METLDQYRSQCKKCGLVIENPRPTTSGIQHFYQDYKPDAETFSQYEKLWDWRYNKVQHYPVGKHLDIGAGNGHFISKTAKYLDSTGIEISDAGIKAAKLLFGIDIIKSRFEDYEPWGKKFDVITTFHILEHSENPVLFLLKCHAILNRGGIIHIAVPNDVEGLRVRILGYKPPKGEIHLTHFTEQTLKNMLEQTGFYVVDINLDRYYIGAGPMRFIRWAFYTGCKVWYDLTGKNLYDTIWITARKKE